MPGLGGGVVGLAGLAPVSPTTEVTLRMRPQRVFTIDPMHGLRHEEDAGEIGGGGRRPSHGELHAQGEDVAGDAGVVDQDVDQCRSGRGSALAQELDGVFAGEVEGRKGFASGTGDGDFLPDGG